MLDMRLAIILLHSISVASYRAISRARAPGQIHGVFSFGSPGPSRPALTNRRGGPCFPGMRFTTIKYHNWFFQEADFAATVTGVFPFLFRHPMMETVDLDLKLGTVAKRPCDDESPTLPRGFPNNFHEYEKYIAAAEGISPLLYNISNIGVRESFTVNRTQASHNVDAYGWRLIGSAFDEGGSTYIGYRVSHLIQQPDTGACILTFQGSMSVQDWTANVNVRKVEWCGLQPTLVHEGFRDVLMRIVRHSDWQADIKPKLSTCSKVYVTGHSLGGAIAELFAACVQNAPKHGESGFEDYKWISF